MPCVIDILRVPKDKDKRRKLSDDDKELIRLYYREGVAIREIAREYEGKCCRRTIQFVLFPERLSTVNYSGHWKKYYDKDKHREAMRRHREHKRKLWLLKNK